MVGLNKVGEIGEQCSPLHSANDSLDLVQVGIPVERPVHHGKAAGRDCYSNVLGRETLDPVRYPRCGVEA